MTPSQKIRREILLSVLENKEYFEDDKDLIECLEKGITEETVDEQYNQLVESGGHYEYESDFRHGTVETKLGCDYSRHYEAKAVATKLSDGTYVGWTYWYGGGKHGDPDSIEWIKDAYNLEVTETEKLVTIQEFRKVP